MSRNKQTDRLQGTGVAIVTPFQASGKIDEAALRCVCDHLISEGIDFIVALGTTGESVNLSAAEKDKVLDILIDQIDGRVALVAGYGGNNTQRVCNSIQDRDPSGIDAILSVSPAYNKPTQAGIVAHFKAVSKASSLPIILYNVPSRTASNISAETTLTLARDCENIIGIKEASGDMDQCMDLVQNRPDGFILLSGDDLLTLPLIAIGFDGVISVVANAFCKEFCALVEAARSADLTTARMLQYQLRDTINALFEQGNPAGIKELMQHMGLCGNTLRLPLVPVDETLSLRLAAALKHTRLGRTTV